IKLNYKDRFLLEILEEMFEKGYDVLEERIFDVAKNNFFKHLEEIDFVNKYIKTKDKNVDKNIDNALKVLKIIREKVVCGIIGPKDQNGKRMIDKYTEEQLKKLYVLNKV